MRTTAAFGLIVAAAIGCGDSTSGTGGGSPGATGTAGASSADEVEQACLDFLAVLTGHGEGVGCGPTLDAAECQALSLDACGSELAATHRCLVDALPASRCSCVDAGAGGGSAGDPVLECDLDGVCDAERAAYAACL